jgi:hypothetical protein
MAILMKKARVKTMTEPIKCHLSGTISYKRGRRPAFPSRFTATVVNVSADGNRMRARVEFPPQTDYGATCPRWSVTRTINLPATLKMSADKEAVTYAIHAAIERMGVGSFALTINFDEKD